MSPHSPPWTGSDGAFLREVQFDLMMGPNCLRILEELTAPQALPLTLESSMRILDLGCGRGLSSMYLACATGAHITAADLWIPAEENQERFERFGLAQRITPVHCDARGMSFAHGQFDALISVDAYHYFGTDDTFMDTHIAPLLKPGGVAAIAVPGLQRPLEHGVPPELLPFWQEGMHFYPPEWWSALLERSTLMELRACHTMRCHDAAWQDWLKCDNEYARRDVDMMAAEGGRYFSTVAMVLVRR